MFMIPCILLPDLALSYFYLTKCNIRKHAASREEREDSNKNVTCCFCSPGVIEFKVLGILQEKHKAAKVNYSSNVYEYPWKIDLGNIWYSGTHKLQQKQFSKLDIFPLCRGKAK